MQQCCFVFFLLLLLYLLLLSIGSVIAIVPVAAAVVAVSSSSGSWSLVVLVLVLVMLLVLENVSRDVPAALVHFPAQKVHRKSARSNNLRRQPEKYRVTLDRTQWHADVSCLLSSQGQSAGFGFGIDLHRVERCGVDPCDQVQIASLSSKGTTQAMRTLVWFPLGCS